MSEITETIDVGYDNNNGITVTINNATPLYYSDIYSNNPDPNINAKSPVFQQLMRYLDSKKDLLGLGGFNDVILSTYGLSREPSYSLLKTYKESIIREHVSSIETKSWAKTKIRASLEVDLIAIDEANNEVYIFRESSMDLSDDIVDANNNKIVPKDIACFSNTILDPLKRSFLTSNALHFPQVRTPLVFNQSFIDGFLKFINCRNVSSTLITETALRINGEDRYTYNYDYNISYSNGGSNGTQISGVISYPNNNDQSNIINKYVIGNENKRLTIQSNNAPNGDRNYKEHIVQIKEMGDVLQVFTMLVWMIYTTNDITATLRDFKKTVLMTTIDAIVFILCIMFRLPCIVYEFKEESDQDIKKPNNGRTRYLQRYRPVELTFGEKKNLILADILNHNNKIIEIIDDVLQQNQRVFISKSESIYLNPDFLNQLKNIIEYLNRCAQFIVANNLLDVNSFPGSIFTNNTDNTDNSGDNTDLSSPVNEIVTNVIDTNDVTSNAVSSDDPSYLKKLEMLLKLNCKIGELFYKNNNGNIFAMKAQKTLT